MKGGEGIHSGGFGEGIETPVVVELNRTIHDMGERDGNSRDDVRAAQSRVNTTGDGTGRIPCVEIWQSVVQDASSPVLIPVAPVV